MIFVLDNYDSFTFNLVQLFGKYTREITVCRNDEVTLAEIRDASPSGIVISPGPGRPEDAGVSVDVIRQCGATIPILGVCLGHQAIGLAFGGRIVHAPSLMHGRTSQVLHNGSPTFEGVPNPFEATRYHSLVIAPGDVPRDLDVTARTADGVIMGVRHRTMPIEGLQFHPESILTEHGELILRNWMRTNQCH